MTIVGFTGTRHGMTAAQQVTVSRLLALYTHLHHGDCVGADLTAHQLAVNHGLDISIHPPSDGRLRAYCVADDIREPRYYLERNRDIVDECDVLIAAPAENCEQTHSGTWYTIRYAELVGKPVLIVWPLGIVSSEGTL